MIETHPFGDFIPNKIKYLFLGSFTAASINSDSSYDWFYGAKRNQFWSILVEVYNLKLNTKETKQKLFRDLQLGITDIIYQCERSKGNSADNNLINIVYNPTLENILKENKIETIFFTSKFVEKLFRKVFKKLIQELPDIKLVTLPSPSPRYALLSKDKKIEIYKKFLPRLNN